MIEDKHPTNPYALILCAGIPRSGSTWTYNATRLLLEAKHPAATVYGCWIADYDPSRNANFHVVKIHECNDQLAIQARAIITSHRDLRDIAASAWSRGWVKNEQEVMRFVETAITFHTYWLELGALDVQYKTIQENPLLAIQLIAARLDVREGGGIDLSSFLARLDALPMAIPGEQLYNPITLLHDRHRMDGRSGYFNNILPANIITQIETTFGTWLQERSFIN